MNSFLAGFCLVCSVALIMCLVLGFAQYVNGTSDCSRLSDYGYVTEFNAYEKGRFGVCYVIMEDGTKVHSFDFDVSDYKKPKTRG